VNLMDALRRSVQGSGRATGGEEGQSDGGEGRQAIRETEDGLIPGAITRPTQGIAVLA